MATKKIPVGAALYPKKTNFATVGNITTCKDVLRATRTGDTVMIRSGCSSTSFSIAEATPSCPATNACVNTELGLPNAGTLTNFQQAVISAYEAHIALGGADPEFCGEVVACLTAASPALVTAFLNILNTALATSPHPLLSNLCAYINKCIDDGLLVVSTNPGNLITTGTDGGAFLNQNAIGIWFEELNGTLSVVGDVVTLVHTPISNAQLWLHRNGVRLQPVLDFTRASNVVTLVIPKFSSDIFYVTYQY